MSNTATANDKLTKASESLAKKISEQEANAQRIEVLREKDKRLKNEVSELRRDVIIARWEEFAEFLENNGLTAEDVRNAVLSGVLRGNAGANISEESSTEVEDISDDLFEKNNKKTEVNENEISSG